MPSPFPGMNLYLELPALWHEFHNRLIVAISDALTPYLQPRYYVAVETRTYMTEQAASEPGGSTSVKVATLEVLAPTVPAAVVHWYRMTKDSPLHALGAELWMGNDRVAKIEPVHCLGLTELQIKTLLVRILDVFSQHSGIKVERFRASVELHPHNCPIRPCPLYPEVNLSWKSSS